MRDTETRRGRKEQTAIVRDVGCTKYIYVVHEKGRERLRETMTRRGRETKCGVHYIEHDTTQEGVGGR